MPETNDFEGEAPEAVAESAPSTDAPAKDTSGGGTVFRDAVEALPESPLKEVLKTETPIEPPAFVHLEDDAIPPEVKDAVEAAPNPEPEAAPAPEPEWHELTEAEKQDRTAKVIENALDVEDDLVADMLRKDSAFRLEFLKAVSRRADCNQIVKRYVNDILSGRVAAE